MSSSIANQYIESKANHYYDKLNKFGLSHNDCVVLLSRIVRNRDGSFIEDIYFEADYSYPMADNFLEELSPHFFEIVFKAQNLNNENFCSVLSDRLIFQLRNNSGLISRLPNLIFNKSKFGDSVFEQLICANIKDFQGKVYTHTRTFEKNHYIEMFDAYEASHYFDRKQEAVNELVNFQLSSSLLNDSIRVSIAKIQDNYQKICPQDDGVDFFECFIYSSLSLIKLYPHTSDLEEFLNDMSVHFKNAKMDAQNFVKKLYKLPEGVFHGVTAIFGNKKYEFSNNRALTIAQFLYTENKSGSDDYFYLSQCIDEPMADRRFSDLFKGKGADDFKNDYIENKGRRWRFNQFKDGKIR
jgi:hypothetical protein